MRESRSDVICWVIDRMRAHVPEITPELALIVEREARAEWGGQRIDYVARTCAHELEERRRLQGAKPVPPEAVADYIAGRPLPEITATHAISRRSLYRALKR